jgi:ubiquinone/menaquinone biosynthesis C-methylase UbiE
MSEKPGQLFDLVAENYDRVRRGYPPELVDAACEAGGLGRGSHVVEVGCGTGKLTRALDERGLRVEAVDPGPDLVRVARRHVSAPTVRFHVRRFEDLDLPVGAFAALFSATAFHWVEPDVGWSKAARILRPGGTLALLTHIGDLDLALLDAWRAVSPEAANWFPRDTETLLAGAETRLGNVSELWAWLMNREIARPEAATLFRDVRLRTVEIETSETIDETLAHMRTQSSYLRLDDARRLQLEQLVTAAMDRAGGTFRGILTTALVTARRA